MWLGFRSPGRDESADASRLTSIERSLLNAIAEAESEKKGLAHRLEDAKNRASMLMGSETYEYGDRDKETEQLLTEAERALIGAEGRSRQLTSHLEHMRRVLELLKKK